MGRSFFRKLFFWPNFFTIAVRAKRDETDSLVTTHTFRTKAVMHSTLRHWVADPMLATDGDETYLFYEACHRGKGRIEVCAVTQAGMPGRARTVLEKEYHLSYPFVFRYHGQWYMIPESCAANEVQLYKATSFPDKWEYQKTLLNQYAVDTTVQELDGRLLMLTFTAQKADEAVTPHAYWIDDMEGIAEPKEIRWESFNPYRVRGAGGLIQIHDRLMRPAQVNRKDSYGCGLVFNELLIKDDTLSEQEIFQISTAEISTPVRSASGLHTYSSEGSIEAIDVRCDLFDLLKPAKKVLELLCTRLNRTRETEKHQQ